MMSKHISHIEKSSSGSKPIKWDLCELKQPRKKMYFAKHFKQHDLLEFLLSLNHQIEQTLIKVNLNKKDIQKNSLNAIKWISKKIESIN